MSTNKRHLLLFIAKQANAKIGLCNVLHHHTEKAFQFQSERAQEKLVLHDHIGRMGWRFQSSLKNVSLYSLLGMV